MNYYHLWCNLKNGHNDLTFCSALDQYLGLLKAKGLIVGFRLSRRKFGFGPADLGDFHVVIETNDLGQLDAAFSLVAVRSGELEDAHRAVYSAVTDLKTALYRDFPDPQRAR
jgi:hypothetical protein